MPESPLNDGPEEGSYETIEPAGWEIPCRGQEAPQSALGRSVGPQTGHCQGPRGSRATEDGHRTKRNKATEQGHGTRPRHKATAQGHGTRPRNNTEQHGTTRNKATEQHGTKPRHNTEQHGWLGAGDTLTTSVRAAIRLHLERVALVGAAAAPPRPGGGDEVRRDEQRPPALGLAHVHALVRA